jgi:hypothetical protein
MPTKPDAVETIEERELVRSALRVSFDLICCSTDANCTSCWVNWLVSRGSSGFWFFSCVVSSSRKASKFSAIVVRSPAGAAVPDAAAALAIPAAMGCSLKHDPEKVQPFRTRSCGKPML